MSASSLLAAATTSDEGQLFLQYCLDGLTNGSLFALIALGYTMVYGIIELINFAHGEVFMIGAYIGWGVLAVLVDHAVGGLHPLWVLPLLLLPAMVLCGALGMSIERFAYRPLYLRGGSRLAPSGGRDEPAMLEPGVQSRLESSQWP